MGGHRNSMQDELELARIEIRKSREARLNAAFDVFDLDGTGELDEEELLHIGESMHGSWTPEQNKEAFEKLDHDQSGTIHRDEFLVIYKDLLKDKDGKEFDEGVSKFMEGAKAASLRRLNDLRHSY